MMLQYSSPMILPRGPTFDYYISTSGSSGNPGTQAAPWDIGSLNTKQSTYTGKRVGLLNGTYNVGTLFQSGQREVPCLLLAGGTSSAPTYIGAVNPATPGNWNVIITGLTGNGYSNGVSVGNQGAMMGLKTASVNNGGYLTISDISFQGCNYQVLEIGNSDFSNSSMDSVFIQHCEFTNNHQAAAVAFGSNAAGVSIYSTGTDGGPGVTFFNCWWHDNLGSSAGSADHFSAIYAWNAYGTTIRQCSSTSNGGCFNGKEKNSGSGFGGTLIERCYSDMSMFTSGQDDGNILGWTKGFGSGSSSAPSTVRNNVFLCGVSHGIDLEGEQDSSGFDGNVAVYNNTVIGPVSSGGMLVFYEQSSGIQVLKHYNNLYYSASGTPGYGIILTNADAFALSDYNMYATAGLRWATVPNGQFSGSSGNTQVTTLAAWKTAIGGHEAASITTAPTFNNTGSYALQYGTVAGNAYQAGKVGGLSSGAACNIGAWDGSVTQIGSTLAV